MKQYNVRSYPFRDTLLDYLSDPGSEFFRFFTEHSAKIKKVCSQLGSSETEIQARLITTLDVRYGTVSYNGTTQNYLPPKSRSAISSECLSRRDVCKKIAFLTVPRNFFRGRWIFTAAITDTSPLSQGRTKLTTSLPQMTSKCMVCPAMCLGTTSNASFKASKFWKKLF